MPTKRTHKERDRVAESVRLSITVSREEWDALHALRDRCEAAMTTHESLQRKYNDLLAVNAEQLAKLIEALMRVDHLKVCLARAEARTEALKPASAMGAL